MSMDVPDLVKIQQSNPNLAVLWRVGDGLYYIGLLGALALMFAGVFMDVSDMATPTRVALRCLAVGLVASVFLGPTLKWVARRRAGIQ
jgi:hypothetical protein